MPTNRGTSAKSPEKPHPNPPPPPSPLPLSSLAHLQLWEYSRLLTHDDCVCVCACVFLALSFSFALGVCTHPTPPTSVSNGPSCDVFPAFLRHKFSSLHFFFKGFCCCCFCLVHIDLFIILRTLISLGKSPSLLNTLLLSLLLLVLMLMLLVCLVLLLLLLVLCCVYANTASVTASARFKPEPRTARAGKQNMSKMPKRSRKNEQPVKL